LFVFESEEIEHYHIDCFFHEEYTRKQHLY